MDLDARLGTPTPPATPVGPRITRSTAAIPSTAPTGPASSTRPNGSAQPDSRHAPTGPSKPTASPQAQSTPKPAPSQPLAMGPPQSALSIDEERAAARAKKFGMISKPLPSSTPSGPSAEVKSERSPITEPARAKSPASRASPAPAASVRRSGSVESRVSERSKREARDREDQERDRARNNRGRDRLPLQENGARSQMLGDKKPADEVIERRRQEDLLQARHEKLAIEDNKEESRRPSRDGHRRETEKERDERKMKERERDKDAEREKEKDRSRDRPALENVEFSMKRKRDEVSLLYTTWHKLISYSRLGVSTIPRSATMTANTEGNLIVTSVVTSVEMVVVTIEGRIEEMTGETTGETAEKSVIGIGETIAILVVETETLAKSEIYLHAIQYVRVARRGETREPFEDPRQPMVIGRHSETRHRKRACQ